MAEKEPTKTKAAYPFNFGYLFPKSRSNQQPSDNLQRKKRISRVIMLADFLLLALIFIFVSNYTGNKANYFGKPSSVMLGSTLFRLGVSYLEEMEVYSFHVTIEKSDQVKDKKPTVKQSLASSMQLGLYIADKLIVKKNWNLESELSGMDFFETKLFTMDISENKIQSLFREFEHQVVKAKDDSLISFDNDKIAAKLRLLLNDKIILVKDISFELAE